MTRRFVIALAAAVLAAACGGPRTPAGPPTPGAGAPKPDLTTAEGVIEASLAAQGGRERMARIQAMRQTGTFVFSQMGLRGPMVTVAAPPRNTVTHVELKGLGKLSQGVSGDVGWELSGMTGARLISGKELAQLLRESTFNAPLRWKELFPKAELAGVVEFEGQQAYKVVLTAPDGDTQTRYFARDSLLPVGRQMVLSTQMGDMPVDAVESDWREVGGIKYPHKLLQRQGPASFEIIVDKIEIDPALDPSTFALPPEIVALQQPQP